MDGQTRDAIESIMGTTSAIQGELGALVDHLAVILEPGDEPAILRQELDLVRQSRDTLAQELEQANEKIQELLAQGMGASQELQLRRPAF